VTVEDNVNPVAICQDVTVQLDVSGIGSTNTGEVDNGSSDNCTVASLVLDNTGFDCNDVGSGNTVVMTVTDVNGNTSTCSATITVEDNVAAEALCAAHTVQLDQFGNGSMVVGDIDEGSNDACGVATTVAGQVDFNCSHTGVNEINLSVTDVNGNVSLCIADVTVEDNVPPVVFCQDATLILNAAGSGTITVGDIDNGSFDVCGVGSSVSPTGFTCANEGPNTVTLTVSDNNSNSNTCTATVTVVASSTLVITSATSPIICPGDAVTLSATGGSDIQWQFDGVNIPGETSNTYDASLAGDYRVVDNGSEACGGFSNEITVSTDGVTATITSSGGTTLCNGATTTLSAGPAGLNYQWRKDGFNIPGETSIDYIASTNGSYDVLAFNLSGCSDISDPIDIDLNPALIADAGADVSIDAGQSVTLGGSPTASGGTAPYFYTWLPFGGTTGLNVPVIANPSASPAETTTFMVQVKDDKFCTATASVTVTIINCTAPVNISVGNITGNSVDITWDSTATATSYTLKYKVKDDPGAYTFLACPTNQRTIFGLDTGTEYEVLIRGNCVGGNSDWSPATFTTNACGAPSSTSVSNLTSTVAKINWPVVSGANSYQVNFREVGSGVWIPKVQTNPANGSKWLTGLLGSTNYEYKVRTNCSFGNSVFTAVETFSTPAPKTGNMNDQRTIQVDLYPNPASSYIFVNYEMEADENAMIRVRDVLGELVTQQTLGSEMGNLRIDTETWSAGNYILEIFGSKQMAVRKFIVVK
jgi:hypothetical protein